MHVGVAIMAIAIIATSVYREQVRVVVSPGDTFEAGNYTMQFEDLVSYAPGVNGIDVEVVARVGVYRDGELVTTMEPGRRFFTNFADQPTAIVAVQGTLMRDLYVFVQGWDAERLTEIQVFINPLQQWLWIGGMIYAVGGLLAFAPFRSSRRVEVEVPTTEGQQPA